MEMRTQGIIIIVIVIVLFVLSLLCAFSPLLYKVQEMLGLPT